jgi:hypothetical protein
MINYIEKGAGLHEVISSAGHTLVQHDGVWVASDEQAVQANIDGYTLDKAKAPILKAIKNLAKDKILAFLPEWKQSNLNARMNELNDIRFERALTPGEEFEIVQLKAVWAKAKAIRVASNTHEANISALTTFEEVLAYDCTANWPGV